MILVLDNAGYHHARDEHYINPNDMKKAQLAAKLREYQILMIPGVGTMPQSGGDEGPIQSLPTQHPDLQRTRLQRFFHEQSAQDGKGPLYHYLIFTPPYEASFQPIELVWSHSKGYVARKHARGRTVTQLREEIIIGLYGDGDRHKPRTSRR
jgi:hypothetical protein